MTANRAQRRAKGMPVQARAERTRARGFAVGVLVGVVLAVGITWVLLAVDGIVSHL